MHKLILASNSPRRRELLDQIQIEYLVDPSDIVETVDVSLSPAEIVLALARQKAEDVALRHPQDVILAADTMVVLNGVCLGKPKDTRDATEMLRALANHTHQVLTGVVLIDVGQRKILEAVESTQVTMGPISEQQIQWYVESEEPFGKAGSYGIQGLAARFVEKIDGCYNNVIGLPVYRVLKMLEELNR